MGWILPVSENNYRAIQLLPLALANQIAAGEVIERPASCIKELIENSLDAGATEIRIEIEAGGLRQIQIKDNGAGIEKADLLLAITPHATSKIQVQQDLFQLTTLGFRGEALASIQSVSRLDIISKRPEASKAYKLSAHLENMPISEAYFSGSQGTTVLIKDLFYNVPARKKFLKSANTEFHHIENLVTALALSHPEVAIYFSHNAKQIVQLPQAVTPLQIQTRISKLLGKNFIDHAVELNVERVGLKLTGFLGLPETFLRTNQQQYFYINGRLIKDKLIMHAIKSFFQDKQLLGAGMYPAYVLYFTIDPEAVDVNVHPTKHEVRFHEPRLIHDFITAALSEVIAQTGLIDKEAPSERIETPEVFTVAYKATDSDSKFQFARNPKSDIEQEDESKINSAYLKKTSDLNSLSTQAPALISLEPMIKIGSYLLWGETIEQSEQGKVLNLIETQSRIIQYFLTQTQNNDWFAPMPMLVPLSVSTPYIEQWLWPERQQYFAAQFGLMYQFKQKTEIVITHLPKIVKYFTHQEREDNLAKLFGLALHNGQSEWQKALLTIFPVKYLCRLALEDWKINEACLEAWHQQSLLKTIDKSILEKILLGVAEAL